MKWTPYSKFSSVHTQNNENNDSLNKICTGWEEWGSVCVGVRADLLVKEM